MRARSSACSPSLNESDFMRALTGTYENWQCVIDNHVNRFGEFSYQTEATAICLDVEPESVSVAAPVRNKVRPSGQHDRQPVNAASRRYASTGRVGQETSQ